MATGFFNSLPKGIAHTRLRLQAAQTHREYFGLADLHSLQQRLERRVLSGTQHYSAFKMGIGDSPGLRRQFSLRLRG
jgi:hypothetical protein